MAYLDADVRGQTELRIHGVSGTRPGDSLEHPHIRRVTGDKNAGIYRRVWEHSDHAEDTAENHLEAYSWGGLTSGSWKRALWLLLLPFMLLNVAYYMALSVPTDSSGDAKQRPPWSARAQRRVSEGAQRVLALSLTVTMILTAVTVAMDLAGWQCSRDTARCSGRFGPGLLDQPTLDTPGRRLAASAALPLLLIGLLWILGHNTWRLAESVDVKGAKAHPERWVTPLEDRAMWNGQVPVARLRALHITAALSTVMIFLSAPLVAHPRDSLLALINGGWDDNGRRWAATVLLVAVAMLALTVLLAALPRYDRERPPTPQKSAPAAGAMAPPETPAAPKVPERWLAYLTCALVTVALVTAARAKPIKELFKEDAGDRPRSAPKDFDLVGQLPWLDDVTLVTFGVQFLVIVVILLMCATQAAANAQQLTLPKQTPEPDPPTVAWGGFGQVIFASLAWVMLGGLSASVIWRSAAVFGNPQGPGRPRKLNDATPLYLGEQFFWAALAALALFMVAVVVGLVARNRLKNARTTARERVLRTYARHLDPNDPNTTERVKMDAQKRADDIAEIWANASISLVLKKAITSMTLAIVVIVGGGALWFKLDPSWPLTGWPRQTVTAGGFVLTGAVLGLLYVGRQAYQNPQFRRTVGIAWDLGTFWPRATHPLAPPCYAERTVPDLLRRIEYIHHHRGQVTLSAHSQGTVIAAAVIAAMRTSCASNVSLVTYGSPLRRLYAQYFPAYFGTEALLRVGELLKLNAEETDPKWSRAHRARWPWLNTYRLSDPIGGQIFVDYNATESAGLIVDHWPETDRARPSPSLPWDELLTKLRQRRATPPNPTDPTWPPQTFENEDVDWQLVDPLFAKRGGDGLWPHPDGHSHYQVDPAFPFAVALVRERRGKYVKET